jgi:hypothetical protein
MITYIPQLTKNWLVTPNVREAFATLAQVSGWYMYENKQALVAAGWTLVWTSDGVTGPAGVGDTTDRWTDKTKAAIRGANATTAQSWAVLENTDGLQLKFQFTGATDDVFAIAMSPSGLYTLAGTPTFPPTASDEVVTTNGNSIVNVTASLDRVMSIFCTSDTRHWRVVLFRAGALLNCIGVDWLDTHCPVGVFGDGVVDLPYITYRYTVLARDPAVSSGTVGAWPLLAIGATGAIGAACRVFTAGASRTNRICGRYKISGSVPGTANSSLTANILATADMPSLQGSATWPLELIDFVGERTANLEGPLGQAVDWWLAPYNTSTVAKPPIGDFCAGFEPGDTPGVTAPRASWCVSLGGGMILAWRNAALTLEQT